MPGLDDPQQVAGSILDDPAVGAGIRHDAGQHAGRGLLRRRLHDEAPEPCEVDPPGPYLYVTARDLQYGDRQFVRGKSLDTFCPMGPHLVLKDEIPNPNDLTIKTILNGEVMQSSSTSEMIFGVAELIAERSQSGAARSRVTRSSTPDSCRM